MSINAPFLWDVVMLSISTLGLVDLALIVWGGVSLPPKSSTDVGS